MQEQYFAYISKVGDSFPIDNQILVATKTNDRRIERECKETEIKIQVKYCGLSKLDYQVRKGIFPLWNHNSFNQQCIIPGYEVCGQILNIGNKVNSKMFSIGDLVIGFLPVQTIIENNLIFNNEISNDTFLLSDNNVDELNGGCSNECISEAHYFLKIPSDMSLIKSASCIFSGIRAYITLFNKTQIKRGDTICIMKGAHWEQTYLLQLAILKCNCQVITTVTTDEEINFLRMIQSKLNSKLSNSLIINGNSMNTSNLHQLTILDLRQYENMEQFQKAIFKETSGLGVDVFICSDYLPIISSNNNNNSNLLTTALNVIKSNGTLVCYDFNNQLTEQHFNQMFRKSINLANILEQSYVQHPHTIGIYLHTLKEIVKDINDELIEVPIGHCFPLNSIQEAHKKVESSLQQNSNLIGKIMIKI
ncbi:hypothetical protein ABK040_008203 [Willaertia magna]